MGEGITPVGERCLSIGSRGYPIGLYGSISSVPPHAVAHFDPPPVFDDVCAVPPVPRREPAQPNIRTIIIVIYKHRRSHGANLPLNAVTAYTVRIASTTAPRLQSVRFTFAV